MESILDSGCIVKKYKLAIKYDGFNNSLFKAKKSKLWITRSLQIIDKMTETIGNGHAFVKKEKAIDMQRVNVMIFFFSAAKKSKQKQSIVAISVVRVLHRHKKFTCKL